MEVQLQHLLYFHKKATPANYVPAAWQRSVMKMNFLNFIHKAMLQTVGLSTCVYNANLQLMTISASLIFRIEIERRNLHFACVYYYYFSIFYVAERHILVIVDLIVSRIIPVLLS